jgi:hypothetical protein
MTEQERAERKKAADRERYLANRDAILKDRARYLAENREKINARRRSKAPTEEALAKRRARYAKRYATITGRLKLLLSPIERKKLSMEWASQKFEAGCALTGLPFSLEADIDSCRVNPEAPSIDRIDPAKGYTEDNCRLIHHWINAAKADMPEARFHERILHLANKIRCLRT